MKDTLVLDYLLAISRIYSAGTVKGYGWALKDWDRFISEERKKTSCEQWEARDIENWQESLAARQLKPSSRLLASVALRNCLKWAARHDRPVKVNLYLSIDPVKVPRRLPRPLEPQHLDRILDYYNKRRPMADLAWWRDRALFLYLITTGARVNEVLQLNIDQMIQGAVVRQKGGTEKVLYTTDQALRAIQEYTARRTDNHPALWVTCGGGKSVRALSDMAVRDIWRRLAVHLNIPFFTTHQTRHTTATELMDAAVPPEVIAKHLGHHGLDSLAGYAELRLGRRQEAVDALDKRLSRMKTPGQRFVAIKGGRGRRVNLI